MNCRKCGSVLHDSSTFCPFCGEVIKKQVQSQEPSNEPQTTALEVLDNEFSTPSKKPSKTKENKKNNKKNNNAYFTENDSPTQNKKSGGFSFIIAILMIALLAGGCFLGYKYLYKESDNKNKTTDTIEESDNKQTQEEKTEEQEPTQEEHDEKEKPNKTKYFEIGAYKFVIPNKISYSRDTNSGDDTIILTDNNTFRTAITFDIGDYETYDLSSDQTITDLENSGYTITNNTIETINDIEYYIYEGLYSESPILYFNYKLDANLIIEGAIVSIGTSDLKDSLNYISEIIKSVQKIDPTSNNEEETTSDIN